MTTSSPLDRSLLAPDATRPRFDHTGPSTPPALPSPDGA